MASTKFESFRELRKGKYDWKVQARIMNLWRGYTKSGDPFKSFNLLLVDNKRARVHAFVPGNVADLLEPGLEVGKLYLFKNFTVKDYQEIDKFRCIHKDIQIVFSNETKIVDLEENQVFVEAAVFDFYDLGDLKQLANQTTYLTDVIGIIKDEQPTIAKLRNRHGNDQTQIKFEISDGRNTVKVTFWDAFAELFAETLKEDLEYPLIIIIGSCRVSEWQEKENISNVAATTFYLNSAHHSVTQMRNMLKEPIFADYPSKFKRNGPVKIYIVDEIKHLGVDDIGVQVMCLLKINQVLEMEKWFDYICTSCYNSIKMSGKYYHCMECERNVPYPEKWFEVWILASDMTGELDIILENIPTQKCIGKSVREICELAGDESFPTILKQMENKEYTIKIVIREENIREKSRLYYAKDIMEGPYLESNHNEKEETQPQPIQDSFCEPSASTYHLESISENN